MGPFFQRQQGSSTRTDVLPHRLLSLISYDKLKSEFLQIILLCCIPLYLGGLWHKLYKIFNAENFKNYFSQKNLVFVKENEAFFGIFENIIFLEM
jgi:hypothetical protein